MTTIAYRSNRENAPGRWRRNLGIGGVVLALAFFAAFLATGAKVGGLADPAIHPLAFITALVAIAVVLAWWAVQGDRRLLLIVVASLALKAGGTYLRVVLLSSVGDARFYDWAGGQVADWLGEGLFGPGDERLSFRSQSTTNLSYIVGWIYYLAGKNLSVAYTAFSFLGFTGTILVYRATTLAVPQVDRIRLAVLLFCMPSMLFWPSTLGKDAWMVCAIGIAALGIAGLTNAGKLRYLALAVAGVAMAGWIRPHVAAALTLAFVVASVWPQRSSRGGRRLKIVIAAVGVILAVSMAARVQEYLGTKDRFDVGAVLEQTETTTAQGGSEFVARPIRDPIGFLVAIPSVLLRPFPHETNSIPQLATSFEGVAVGGLAIASRKRLRYALSLWRTNAFVRFAWLYLAGFIIAFSAVSNFGILARQRSQAWPLFLLLLAMPVAAGLVDHSGTRAQTQVESSP